MPLFKKDPWIITVYRTYGAVNHLYIHGRALEDEHIRINKNQSFLRTIRNTWNQIFADELKNTPIQVELPNGQIVNSQTNLEGYFEIDLSISDTTLLKTDEEGYMKFKVRFAKHPNQTKKQLQRIREESFDGELLIPPKTAKFGIISDIDDTILHTGVNSFIKWRLIYNTFFRNAHNRIPLEGTSDLYRELHNGKSGKEQNPLFYISNSPWNLYGYLDVFLSHNNFPKGSLLLRDLRYPWSNKPRKREHKPHAIKNMLIRYPNMKFILIGDGGERDLDLYMETADKNPDRIAAIYIRRVKHKRRMHRISSVINEHNDSVPILLVENSRQVIEHAKGLGLI